MVVLDGFEDVFDETKDGFGVVFEVEFRVVFIFEFGFVPEFEVEFEGLLDADADAEVMDVWLLISDELLLESGVSRISS